MRLRIFAVTISIGLIAGLSQIALRAQSSRTVNDGVYTAEQADRGEREVGSYQCQYCHGSNFEGGAEEQPPLKGYEWVGIWAGFTLDDLYRQVSTMPPDRSPVDPVAIPDVIAYLLKINGYPAGDSELTGDAETLKQIRIVGPVMMRSR